MSPTRARSRPILGAVLLVLGAALLSLAFLPSEPVHGLVGDAAPAMAVTGGMVAAGVLVLLGGFTALRDDASGSDDGFVSLDLAELEPNDATPQEPEPQEKEATTKDPVSEEVQRMRALDAKIKKLDRRINKAKVKLGTGKLSPEGYQRVVEELQEKRAALEKRRVDMELDQGGF